MPRFVSLASVFLISALAGCSDSTGPISLALNRARWENQNPHNYRYTGRMSCFCPNSGQDVTVVVLADTVFSARVVATAAEVPKGVWLTVSEFFEFIRRFYGGGDYVERVQVDYHPDLGYPTFIDLTCSRDVLDCGTRIEIRDLIPIDANLRPLPSLGAFSFPGEVLALLDPPLLDFGVVP
jgi:hypothetical protein